MVFAGLIKKSVFHIGEYSWQDFSLIEKFDEDGGTKMDCFALDMLWHLSGSVIKVRHIGFGTPPVFSR